MKKEVLILTLIAILISPLFISADITSDTIKESGVQGGIIVHIGGENETLPADLYNNEKFLVQSLDTDPARVKKTRALLRSKGLNGRVTANLYDGLKLPYIDNLVNFLFVNAESSVSDTEMLRVLAPGGIALIAGQKIIKEVPSTMDEWTHFLYGPENNAVSTDTDVGISRSLQWIMPPSWGRHHNLVPSMSVMVSAGGRIYYIIDDAPIAIKGPTENWQLVCRDAFNGLLLWKKPITNWGWKRWSAVEFGGTMRFKRPDQLFRRIVADGDRLFVTLGFNNPVVALDGKTGNLIKKYDGTENTSAILYKNNMLYLARNVLGDKPGKDILAVNTETGAIIWERKGYTGITSRGDELKAYTDSYITLGKDKVFFMNEENVVALDIKTGKEIWTSPRPLSSKGILGHYDFEFKNFVSLVYHDGIVYLGQLFPSEDNLNKWQMKDMTIYALKESYGEKIWEHKGMSLAHFSPPDLFINNGMVWTMKKEPMSLIGLDMKTGEVKKEYPSKDILVKHHHRCYRNRASKNLYLYGEEGIEYIDFATGAVDVHHWMRGACAYGIMPANGLIYLPTHACGCHSNSKLHGFLALANPKNPRISTDDGVLDKLLKSMVKKFEKGPAFEKSGPGSQSPADWPAFRANNLRSSKVATKIAEGTKKAWSVQLKGELTQPIAVGDTVYVAEKDAHTVHAINMSDGSRKWSFNADGRIDSPPSFSGGRILFGTHNGSVYSLTSDKGELAWRFMAAPSDMQLTAYNQLESVWPVHGSVLVNDDKAYFTAGRSMNLDSGLYVYALDASTGEIIQQTTLSANDRDIGEIKNVVLPDVLSSDGKNIYMRTMQLDAEDIKKHSITKSSGYLKPNDGGLMDDTLFNSSYRKYMTAQAQLLVFDDKIAYGMKAQNKLLAKSYSQDIITLGSGYKIFAIDLSAKAPTKSKTKKKKKGPQPASGTKWEQTIAVRADSMVLTDNAICFAGTPDVAAKEDPWATVEKRKGGVLLIVDKKDGKTIAEHKLESAPVFDGIIAARGNLFLSLKNGRLQCWK